MTESVTPLDQDHPDDPSGDYPFVVDDDAKAAWAMRKLAKLRHRMTEVDAIADREAERVQLWRDAQLSSVAADAAYFEHLLIAYAIGQRENGRKSVSVPHGTIRSRAGTTRVDVADSDTFVAWAKQNSPDLVRVRYEPDKAALKALITDDGDIIVPATGEVVPGVSITRTDTTYTIETE